MELKKREAVKLISKVASRLTVNNRLDLCFCYLVSLLSFFSFILLFNKGFISLLPFLLLSIIPLALTLYIYKELKDLHKKVQGSEAAWLIDKNTSAKERFLTISNEENALKKSANSSVYELIKKQADGFSEEFNEKEALSWKPKKLTRLSFFISPLLLIGILYLLSLESFPSARNSQTNLAKTIKEKEEKIASELRELSKEEDISPELADSLEELADSIDESGLSSEKTKNALSNSLKKAEEEKAKKEAEEELKKPENKQEEQQKSQQEKEEKEENKSPQENDQKQREQQQEKKEGGQEEDGQQEGNNQGEKQGEKGQEENKGKSSGGEGENKEGEKKEGEKGQGKSQGKKEGQEQSQNNSEGNSGESKSKQANEKPGNDNQQGEKKQEESKNQDPKNSSKNSQQENKSVDKVQKKLEEISKQSKEKQESSSEESSKKENKENKKDKNSKNQNSSNKGSPSNKETPKEEKKQSENPENKEESKDSNSKDSPSKESKSKDSEPISKGEKPSSGAKHSQANKEAKKPGQSGGGDEGISVEKAEKESFKITDEVKPNEEGILGSADNKYYKNKPGAKARSKIDSTDFKKPKAAENKEEQSIPVEYQGVF